MSGNEERKECVVLVHGTWGRSSLWPNDDTPTVALLREKLGSTMDFARFTWCGRNRQFARSEAAEDLARTLIEGDLARYDGVHVIAHSHGGNIAISASEIARNRVLSITTLATPFISAERRSDVMVQRRWFVPALLAAFIAICAVGYWNITDIRRMEDAGRMWLLFTAILGWLILSAGLIPLVVKLIGVGAMRLEPLYTRFGQSPVPILPVYLEGDEAYFVLASALSLQGRVDFLAQWVLAQGRHLTKLWVTMIVMTLVFAVFGAAGAGLTTMAILVATFCLLLGLSMLLIMVANWMTPFWTFYLVLGADTFLHSLFLRIRVSQHPSGDAVREAVVAELPADWRRTARSTLRHSQICFDARWVEAATEWIRRNSRAAFAE
jgi:pimeloyl-ACP methyl ester carboxylesterase